MADRLTAPELEGPDLFRFRRPSRHSMRVFGLGMLVAADLGGLVPHGPSAAWAVATVAVTGLLRECVRSGR
ncbi:hypothetical protein AQJ46_48275 [Streptomyces canus]|uniref:Uncharacterized protein n=1 Tax=Streptomyces canus TaxID=58343 RepID=A0A101RKJ9_9ACTN|nr:MULTISPECIES: hypothetical protein [Streptomyces]KUN57185.1 hypothetical protein AQJ46_48275 [Streptomyces canus]MDI5903693.1 hypothetical protein [Streptomyces sp. 12257]